MNIGVEQGIEHMSTHIRALEVLILQQQNFMEESAITWRNLLEKEKALSEKGWHERDQINERFQALSDKHDGYVKQIADLQFQVEESRQQLRAAEQAFESDRIILPATEEMANNIKILTAQNDDMQAQLAEECLRAARADEEAAQTRQERDEAQARLTQMSADLARLANILRQRQEEIEQAWTELAIHRQKIAELETELDSAAERETILQHKLKDSDNWIFKLAGERAEQEKQLGTLTRERNIAVEKLAIAHKDMDCLRQQIDSLAVQSPALPRNDKRATAQLSSQAAENIAGEIMDGSPISARKTVGDERQNSLPTDALPRIQTNALVPSSPSSSITDNSPPIPSSPMTVDALMESLNHRDKNLLLNGLIGGTKKITENLAPSRISPMNDEEFAKRIGLLKTQSQTSTAPPPREPMPIAVPSRNPQLERQLKAAEAQLQWLRHLSLACLEKPRKWAFMPLSWHLKRLPGRLKRKGLFDEQAYLSRYPDVKEAGMVPLVHYLMHGIEEGRER